MAPTPSFGEGLPASCPGLGQAVWVGVGDHQGRDQSGELRTGAHRPANGQNPPSPRGRLREMASAFRVGELRDELWKASPPHISNVQVPSLFFPFLPGGIALNWPDGSGMSVC